MMDTNQDHSFDVSEIAPVDRASDSPQRPVVSDRARLLIVDDVPENRDILKRRFERHGFLATEADGGIQALALLERQAFDLVLLDMMMPDMSGLEVLARIRAKHTPGVLPVIMVTARTQSEDIVGALKAGANDYISKPVDFSIALARVAAQLDRKRAEDRILHLNGELSEANEALECRVAERTKALVEANQQLQSEMAKREKSQATIVHLAHHDPLTGLGNRLLFDKQLNEAVEQRKQRGGDLAVLLIDLDGFKMINDTLGHATGDAVLQHLAKRLRNGLRAGDRIGRLGGDEFVVVQFGDQQPTEAAALATRLIEIIKTPFRVGGHNVVIGASIGIAIADDEYRDVDRLLRAADLAMYRAKTEGRGRFRFFEPEFDRQVRERRSLERELRAAVDADALEIAYQPLINLQTNRVSGFEALSRWKDPHRGWVSPGDFIPLAEEIGLIDRIGERVLQRACAEAVRWPEDVTIAVNLSPAQFVNGHLFSAVKGALTSSGLNPRRLELEITESVFLRDTESNLVLLRKLGELGVRISMDDFGTGYSSLAYLRSFPFDKIKIDQSFVQDLPNSQSSIAIVQAVCGLARSFGASTTAEGVETAEQLTRIRAEGCTEVQGYFFSRPLPASEIHALLTTVLPTESIGALRLPSGGGA